MGSCVSGMGRAPRYPEGQWRTAITIKRLALRSAKAVKPQRQPPLPPLATSSALSRSRVPSETQWSLAGARRCPSPPWVAPSSRRVLSPNGRGGWTPLRPLRALPETCVATREEGGVLGFPRPSGVPRGPATSTGSLASQRHPGKFPKVPGRRRGMRPARRKARLPHSRSLLLPGREG